jgi:NAD(P)H-nitrite reductase large subunit
MTDIRNKLKEIGPYTEKTDDSLLVCRCEEVTKGEIRRAVHEGIFTIEEMRRYLRAGMGLCQGQTCGKLVKSIIAAELHVSPDEIEPATSRAPARPVEMEILARDGGVSYE